MLWFALLLAPMVVGTANIPLTPVEQRAMGACQARLTAKLGEISTFSVSSAIHRGKRVTLIGILSVNQKAASAPPGMMTPAHIIVTPYRFECRVASGQIERLRTWPSN
jgi:hypothetical protein